MTSGERIVSSQADCAFERQQMRLDVESAGESRECAAGPDNAVAWRDDRYRIFTVRRADGPRSGRTADLSGDLGVRAGLSERNRQQRLPDFALKHRSREVQLQGELRASAGKVLRQLPLRLEEHRMKVVFGLDVQSHAVRAVVLPQDCG